MARRCFELSTTVPGAPSAVIDFLMDLEQQRALHPYLVSATPTGTGTSYHGTWWDWQVVERPRVGPFRARLRFRVRMTRTSATSLESRLNGLPGCHLRGLTRAVATGDGDTLLTENVAANGPVLLVGYLARQARFARTQTLARIPGAFAAQHTA